MTSANAMKPKAFLSRPAYYRLAYHGIAQRLNHAKEMELDSDRPQVDELDGRIASIVDEALAKGRELENNIRIELDWFEVRQKGSKWWKRLVGRDSLTQSDRRLVFFLRAVVDPSLQIALAGAELYLGDVHIAEARLANIRAQASTGELLYRPLYNLACYEVELGAWRARSQVEPNGTDTAQYEIALALLAKALADAPGRHERDALARWAAADPTLKPLSTIGGSIATDFAALIARYESVASGPRILYVSPSGDTWKITESGATLSTHATKDAALEAAKTSAQERPPARVIIQRANGRFERDMFYRRQPTPRSTVNR